MIIFDTSALFALSPDDPKFDLLRALKQSGQQQVSIPWMVQEELVAQRVLRHAEAHSAAVSATRDLNRVAPWLGEQGPKPFDRSEAGDHWRQAYGRLFEIVETSGDVARQALLREANCEKPAKGPDAKDKGGARDAAIWLSVVEYLKNNPGKQVYFVTHNTRDFGDGSEFPRRMATDIEGLGDRLTLLTSFDSVVSTFSTPLDIDEKHIEEGLASLLTSEAALTLLAGAVRERLAAELGPWGGNAVQVFPSLLAAADTYPPVRWSTWASEPKVVLRRVQDVAGHKIGEDAWYTAIVDWIVVGLASVPGASPTPLTAHLVSVPTWIACQWRTKLLFSSRPGEPPVLLQDWPPESLDPAEQDEWQPLVRKAVPQITTPKFPDFPTGSPWALLILAIWCMMSAKKKRDGSIAGNPGNLFDALGDTPEDDDPPDSSA